MRLGIDLGGTKIEALAIDDDGAERLRKRVPTPQGDYPGVLRAVGGLAAEFESALGVRFASVGIGTPGALSPGTGRIQNSNSTCLIGKPLDADLRRELDRPVRLANDANCFALSEAVDGAAAGGSVVFGVILGTGVGGGIVVDKRVLAGRNAIAGEWGHNPLPRPGPDETPGPECYCGRRGCVESFLSGPALARGFEAASGVRLDPPEILRRAAAGGEAEEIALRRYEERLARALAGVINLLDPDVIVLGGGLSNADRLYASVPKLWAPHVFMDGPCATRLVKARHGDSSGVRGAAWL